MLSRFQLFATPWIVACPWNSPGKNTGVGCHSLLQEIFLTQESNPYLLHYRQILYRLSHMGSPLNDVSGVITISTFTLALLFCLLYYFILFFCYYFVVYNFPFKMFTFALYILVKLYWCMYTYKL